ncbi:MAG: hypothetical protein JRJ12_14985 [Deltaproteobacteria bacterium]|nr:hypothetical protein [Deltaproteobacteria bacterium]
MNGRPLPDQDHVARYCKPKTLGEDGRPSRTSFMLKAAENYLSVNWLEYFGSIKREDQLNKIRQHIQLSLASTGKFAVLNVGATLKHIHTSSRMTHVTILHEPTSSDPSHSGIHGYGHEDDLIADLIAEVVLETYPAK